jgi:uncharacterized sulfatase
MADDRPNVLFFFSDQQRWDTCGCYGQSLNVTPNLDRMAGQGVRFDNAFTCQPVCGPARACLQTGLYATQTGVYTNGRQLPRNTRTMAHHLGDIGYRTAYVGKWHLASARHHEYDDKPIPVELRGGYRDFWCAADILEFTSHGYGGHMWDTDGRRVDFPEDRYRADAVTDIALEYLRNGRSGDDPFFLMVSYIEPHHQNDRNRYEGPEGSKERFADYTPPRDLVDTPAEGDWRENYPDYLGCCNSLDSNLGRYLEELESQGILDNTVVIYTSDHGSHFRTRNGEYKRSCHDACIRVPLVVRGPGFQAGQVVDRPVSILDVPPTILTAAGLLPPEDYRGWSLQPLSQDGQDPRRSEEVFLQISEDHIGRAIRTPRWTYEVYVPGTKGRARPGSDAYVECHLYDNENDPHQLNNLVTDPEHTELRAQLAEKLKAHMRRAGEGEPVILPAP